MVITSKDNEKIKHIKKLKEKKYRDMYNEYLIEGIKIVEEAIRENVNIKTIIICDDCDIETSISEELRYEIAKRECIYVPEKIFITLTDVTTPQSIMAVVEKGNGKSEISFNEDLYLVLDNIQDPGNMGTILRTADSINLKQIIVSKGTADVYNPKVVRSTMGAIFRVNVIVSDNLIDIIKGLKKHKIKIMATNLEESKSIYEVDYKKSAIVIGNEANGVSKDILNIADEKIRIPMLGKTESLNAAVATGIVLYEAVRRKL